MTIQEQNYADYLFNLADPVLVAASWNNVINGVPQTPQGVEYHVYWSPLNATDKEESEYRVFSDLYDRINISIHPMYEMEFNNVGYSLSQPCKRKKAPAPH